MKLDELQELNVALPLCNNKNSINNAIKIVYNLGQHTEDISAVCFSPNKAYCSLGSSDGSIYIYNSDDSKLIMSAKAKEQSVAALCWSHDSRYLIIGLKSGSFDVYDVDNKKGAAHFPFPKDIAGLEDISVDLRTISSLSMSSFSGFLALGLASGTILVFDTQKAVLEGNWELAICDSIIKGHKSCVTGLCFHINDEGKQWLASCADNKIKIWNFEEIVEGGELSYIKFTDTAKVLSICFSPDRKSIASGSADNTIKIWNVGKNKEGELLAYDDYEEPLYILSGHSDAVSSVQYNSDGRLLLSGSHDKTVQLWDMTAEPKKLKTLEMKSKVCHLHLSGDDTYIVTGLENRAISITTFAKSNMVHKVSNILLSEKENIDTFITKIFPDLPILTRSFIITALRNSNRLAYLLPQLLPSQNRM